LKKPKPLTENAIRRLREDAFRQVLGRWLDELAADGTEAWEGTSEALAAVTEAFATRERDGAAAAAGPAIDFFDAGRMIRRRCNRQLRRHGWTLRSTSATPARVFTLRRVPAPAAAEPSPAAA
jgi:hypothetical protein